MARGKYQNANSGWTAPNIAALLAALFLFWPQTAALSQPPPTGRSLQKKQEIQKLGQKEKQVLAQLEQAEQRINALKKSRSKIKEEKGAVQKERNRAQIARDRLAREMKTMEDNAARRLAARYKASRLGLLPALFGADSFFELAVKNRHLGLVIDQDKKNWEELARKKRAWREQELLLEKKQARLVALDRENQQNLSGLAAQKKQRKELLTRIHKQKELLLAAVQSLEKSRRQLGSTLKSLKSATKKSPEPKTEKIGARPKQSPRPLASAAGFEGKKGRLPLPIDGVNPRKGSPAKTGKHAGGVRFPAPAGQPVRSVGDGRVAFSGWFTGYGNMMIIDHGEHYFSIFAHAEDLFKQKDEPVVEGEVIATVGDTGSLEGPGLYFELRRRSKTLDPTQWFLRER